MWWNYVCWPADGGWRTRDAIEEEEAEAAAALSFFFLEKNTIKFLSINYKLLDLVVDINIYCNLFFILPPNLCQDLS